MCLSATPPSLAHAPTSATRLVLSISVYGLSSRRAMLNTSGMTATDDTGNLTGASSSVTNTAKHVWHALLGAEAGSDAQYDARIHGRKLQLANVDRAAPPPATPLLEKQYRKALRRTQRHAFPSHVPPPPRKSKTKNSKRKNQRLHHDEMLSLDQVQPLVHLWTAYIRDALHLRGMTYCSAQQQLRQASWANALQTSLLKMDWTGAHITGTSFLHGIPQLTMASVVRSSQPNLVHTSGIVVKETHETFAIVQKNLPTDVVAPPKCKSFPCVRNKTQSLTRTGIPKCNTVFQLALPLDDGQLGVDLHGNQVRYTLPVRVTRKHKARKTMEI